MSAFAGVAGGVDRDWRPAIPPVNPTKSSSFGKRTRFTTRCKVGVATGALIQEAENVSANVAQQTVRDVQDLDYLFTNLTWTSEELQSVGIDSNLLHQWATRARELARATLPLEE